MMMNNRAITSRNDNHVDSDEYHGLIAKNRPRDDDPSRVTHFVAFIHGLNGNSSHGVVMEQKFYTKLANSDSVYFYRARCNELSLRRLCSTLKLTLDGIDAGGQRFAKEIIAEMSKFPNLRFFSIVGYSLGGLYARVVIERMYREGVFETIQPVFFVTFVTPHCGVRRPKESGFVNLLVEPLSRRFIGKTGRQLILEDTEYHRPFLTVMTERDSSYMRALKSFRYHMLYSSIKKDFRVPYSTAAMLPFNPFRLAGYKHHECDKFHRPPGYPHVFMFRTPHDELMRSVFYDDADDGVGVGGGENDEAAAAAAASGEDNLTRRLRKYFHGNAKFDELNEMMHNLNVHSGIQWERINIDIDSYLCHAAAVGRVPFLTSAYHDVVQHFIDTFHQRCSGEHYW